MGPVKARMRGVPDGVVMYIFQLSIWLEYTNSTDISAIIYPDPL